MLSTSPTAKNKDLPLNLNGLVPLSDRGKSKTSPSPLSRREQSPDDDDPPSPQHISFPTLQPQTVKEEPRTPPQPAKLVVELERQPSQVSYHTISDVGDLPVIEDEDEFETLTQRRGQARTGSITEQIVDVPGGLRKLVLETTSSSEDAEHEAQEAEAAYTEDTGSTSRPGTEGGGGKKGDESKTKKKKRHKKHGRKRGGGDAEDTPLLGGS